MPDDRGVIAANRAFYAAFRAGDYGRLEALWAQRSPLLCTHPSWPALHGREAVLQSWRDILDGGPPPIECLEPRVTWVGELALLTCLEQIDQNLLAATNIFVREDDEWRLIHHHAGQLAVLRAPPTPPPSGAIH